VKRDDPAQGRAPADALNVVDQLTASGRHGGRFANVTVNGMRRLGLHGTGLFGMGFACGRYFDEQGSFKRLNGLPVGAVVDPSRLPDVLALAGVSEKTWENNVSTWIRIRMAHRCKPGFVALFADPRDGAQATCPKCSKPLAAVPSAGSASPVSREESSRLPGESEHESLVASNAERTVVETAAVPSAVGVQVQEVPPQEALQKSRRGFIASVISASLIETSPRC
jgi:hypothetical protein